MSSIIETGDIVILIGLGGKFIIKIEPGLQEVTGLGVVNTTNFVGKGYGDLVTVVDQEYILLKPSLYDKVDSIKRKAQIILPKDGLQIIGMCSIHSGSVVIEGGAGSGALTIMLAHFVAPDGKVITYDNRKDFAEKAQRNLKNAGYQKYVDLKISDVTDGFDEKDVDAVILDIPNPWEAVEHAKQALAPGGYFAVYIPTTNQVEKAVIKMRECGFEEVKAVETLQRKIEVGEGGVRPSFSMLGHTGYVVCCRKMI